MNLAAFRATSKPVKHTPAAIFAIPAARWAADGFLVEAAPSAGVATHAYMTMCVAHDLTLDPASVYVTVDDPAEVDAVRTAVAAFTA